MRLLSLCGRLPISKYCSESHEHNVVWLFYYVRYTVHIRKMLPTNVCAKYRIRCLWTSLRYPVSRETSLYGIVVKDFFYVFSRSHLVRTSQALSIIGVLMVTFKLGKPSTNNCFRRRKKFFIAFFSPWLNLNGIFARQKTVFNEHTIIGFVHVLKMSKVPRLKLKYLDNQ